MIEPGKDGPEKKEGETARGGIQMAEGCNERGTNELLRCGGLNEG